MHPRNIYFEKITMLETPKTLFAGHSYIICHMKGISTDANINTKLTKFADMIGL